MEVLILLKLFLFFTIVSLQFLNQVEGLKCCLGVTKEGADFRGTGCEEIPCNNDQDNKDAAYKVKQVLSSRSAGEDENTDHDDDHDKFVCNVRSVDDTSHLTTRFCTVASRDKNKKMGICEEETHASSHVFVCYCNTDKCNGPGGVCGNCKATAPRITNGRWWNYILIGNIGLVRLLLSSIKL